mgnify:CR=1 FL=1
MWRGVRVLLLCVALSQVAWGGELPLPTPRKDRPVADELWMRKVAQEWNSLVVTTTNPNGNIRANQVGDLLIYNNSGSYKLCVCITLPTTWRCSANALTAP